MTHLDLHRNHHHQGRSPALLQVVMDPYGRAGQVLMTAAHVSGIPHAFVVDDEGTVQHHGHPADPSFEAAVRKACPAPLALIPVLLCALHACGEESWWPCPPSMPVAPRTPLCRSARTLCSIMCTPQLPMMRRQSGRQSLTSQLHSPCVTQSCHHCRAWQ